MNVKLVLSRCYTLLFRETQLEGGSDSKELVNDIIKDIRIAENNMLTDREGPIMSGLKDLVLDLLRRQDPTPMEFATSAQTIRMVCGEDTALYEGIRDTIILPLEREQLLTLVSSLKNSLLNYVREQKLKELISKTSSTLNYRGHEIKNMNSFIRDFIAQVDSYSAPVEEKEDPAIISNIDLGDVEAVAGVFDEINKSASGESVIRTPWQGLNRMLQGGFRRDQLAVINASKHHGKSLISAGCIVGAAIYNDPYKLLIDKSKKPMLMLISSEDDMPKILAQIYKFLKENLDGVKVDEKHLASIDRLEAAKFIKDKIESRGYKFNVLRVIPSSWTLNDIKMYIMNKEAQGYEIQFMVVDYLNMFPKVGLFGDNDAAKIQNLYQQFRNFVVAHRIATLTPHQMSSDGLELIRSGKKDVAKIVANNSYYDGCKGIGREVDLEISICKVIESGVTYMTFARGKHRLATIANEKDLYTVYMFEDIGGLRFDADGDDLSMKRVGAIRDDNGKTIEPFWDEDSRF